jgi:hypothetical protein
LPEKSSNVQPDSGAKQALCRMIGQVDIIALTGHLVMTSGRRISRLYPVTANMSFDSHLVVSHVVVTAIMSSDGCQAVARETADPDFL